MSYFSNENRSKDLIEKPKDIEPLNKENTIVYIYHEGFLKDLKKDKISKYHVAINSKLTLVERLENAYLIQKIMEL